MGLLVSLAISSLAQQAAAQQSVARQWNEALLDVIRIDFPAPTVHSRNLYHTSAAMYDAWQKKGFSDRFARIGKSNLA